MTPSQIEVRKDFHLTLYGFSGPATPGRWADTGMRLMNRLWHEVKSRNLPNKGLNVWVYDAGDNLFAGVELTAAPPEDSPLEKKTMHLARYVSYKHVGPYDKIGDSIAAAQQEFKNLGIRASRPYLEIYGHHHDDPNQLETEMLWNLA